MEHTPGPWHVDYRPETKADTLGRPLIVTKDGYQPIAGIYGKSASSEANARLIAAAPSLLLALQRIEDESHNPVVERIARAAIEEAQGD